MRADAHQKIKPTHLKRTAYLYIRQSTLRQVFENVESTQRQYALRQHAIALGWQQEQIVVIDSDLGQSGASAADREGFQRLVTEVSLGHAGIVLGLEVSRLARNSMDWHRLLEICALSDTLILDEDGVYDPAHFNDRLLLGLKGTMSEAELHVLRARLQGGILNKARRGELFIRPPIGFAYDAVGRMILDPDQQIQRTIRRLFDTFQRTGSAMATVRDFRNSDVLFPRRIHSGPTKGDVIWGKLEHSQVLRVLHNPRYAGVFVYGLTRTRKGVNGDCRVQRLPREEWHTFLPESHPAYISWPEYERNLKRLRESAQAIGSERRKSPPREGPALLQGLIICGKCGRRMTLRYHVRQAGLCPEYVCQRKGIENAEPPCQRIPGLEVDRVLSDMLLELVNPLALDVALTVQEEVQARLEDTDHLRKQYVERARYEAELAQRRYMRVDPENRLVADTLEADWNQKLRALAEAQEQYEQRREQDRQIFNQEQRAAIMALAQDFPRLWRDPATEDRDRKRMIRLLVEDVTMLRSEQITVHVRFRGGATRTVTLPNPLRSWEGWMTDAEVVGKIDQLLDTQTFSEIAAELNRSGFRSGKGQLFTSRYIARIQKQYALRSRFHRLRAGGLLTLKEMASVLSVIPQTVKIWSAHGLLKAHAYTDKPEHLYEPVGLDMPRKAQGVRLCRRQALASIVSQCSKEVQCEA
ncbi:MAG TPA: recombinase family protein [Candidatus Sulfotelmatobacter sp.]|nr:recombinase family protein [Candidatus Sulfotelmatobacter sp.]